MEIGDIIYGYSTQYGSMSAHDGLPAHWREYEIVGETKVSWIISGGTKVPKKKIEHRESKWPYRTFVKTLDDVERFEFVRNNKWKIRDQVGQCDDCDKLKEIQRILEE